MSDDLPPDLPPDLPRDPPPDLPPWEPPFAGDEIGHLLGAIDRQRATFRWKTADLDAAGLAVRLPSSSLSLGGLLKHLARAEDEIVTWKLAGEPPSEPWSSVDWSATPEWDFESAAGDPPDELYALWDSTVERARARVHHAIDDGGLDQRVALGEAFGIEISLRRLLFDLLEEYGRHTGHADLLREAVDGRVGEDPPWPG